MEKNFKIGDLVKFINDKNCYDDYGIDSIVVPIFGKIYKVRKFSNFGGILLEGVTNKEYFFDGFVDEPGFSIERFELVQSVDEKISITINEKRNIEISESVLTIDEILDKINKYGIKSLTEKETKILKSK